MAHEQKDGRVQSVWEQRWRERIAAWRQSGLSQQAFCRAQGLSVSSFSHWKSELVKRDGSRPSPEAAVATAAGDRSSKAPRWTEVRWPELRPEVALSAPEGSVFEIVLPHGLAVRLGPHFEAAALRRLLAVLEERPC